MPCIHARPSTGSCHTHTRPCGHTYVCACICSDTITTSYPILSTVNTIQPHRPLSWGLELSTFSKLVQRGHISWLQIHTNTNTNRHTGKRWNARMCNTANEGPTKLIRYRNLSLLVCLPARFHLLLSVCLSVSPFISHPILSALLLIAFSVGLLCLFRLFEWMHRLAVRWPNLVSRIRLRMAQIWANIR